MISSIANAQAALELTKLQEITKQTEMQARSKVLSYSSMLHLCSIFF